MIRCLGKCVRVCVCVWERERERERERDRDRDRDRETDQRETERQKDRQRHRQIDREQQQLVIHFSYLSLHNYRLVISLLRYSLGNCWQELSEQRLDVVYRNRTFNVNRGGVERGLSKLSTALIASSYDKHSKFNRRAAFPALFYYQRNTPQVSQRQCESPRMNPSSQKALGQHPELTAVPVAWVWTPPE